MPDLEFTAVPPQPDPVILNSFQDPSRREPDELNGGTGRGARWIPKQVRDDERVAAKVEPNGFSLVELMVVLFIIGLLATVVLINVLPSQDKAMRVKAQGDIATLGQALEMYRLDNMGYPGPAEGLGALRTPPANLPQPQNYRSGGYVRTLPDDPWGRPYQYKVPGSDGRPFDIVSLGADGQPGGQDNDADITADKR